MISDQLLQAKLQIPRRRAPALARSRLNARLNSGLESKLILISAPAGFGKTTLLTEWLSSVTYRSTWLSLDENDNDPALFVAYFIAALKKVKSDLGETSAILTELPPDPQPLVTALLNEISLIRGDFVMVLDDYHLIENKNIHKALSFSIDNFPPNMHFVISTRSDPPLNLAHLRGRGQLTEIRADELRLTRDEIDEFLNRLLALNLTEEEINLLNIRSEGWIAGLQMAAITLKDRSDVSGFIKAFARSGRDISDYLFEEVFNQQPQGVQAFLLETAILDHLSPSLCDAVRGRQDSDEILEKIEKANLFIFPSDDEMLWYHYHSLFRDLLQHTLGKTNPEVIPVLHRRASEWYEQENLYPSAISHALKAKDYDRAARLIEKQAGEILIQGELATYLSWMDSFPQSIIQMYPILILHRLLAEVLVSGMTPEDVEARLLEVERLDPKGQIKGVEMAVRAVALGNQSDMSQNPEICRKALELLPTESTFWRGVALVSLGQFRLLEGDVADIPTAIKVYNEAIEISRKHGVLYAVALALYRLAETQIAAGHLQQAQNHFQEILEMAVDRHGQQLSLASFGFFGLAILYREWNDLDKALRCLKKGSDLEAGKLGHWQIDGITELARIRQAQGDMEGASQSLQKARQLLSRFPRYKNHESIVTVYEIDLALARGDIKKVNAWVKEHDLMSLIDSISIEGEIPRHIPGYNARELELTVLVKAYIGQNKPAEALKGIDALFKTAEKLGRAKTILEAHILSALAYKGLGEMGEAMSHLKQALLAAEPERYVRVFLDEGSSITSLLYEAARQGVTPAYTHRLIAGFPALESAPRATDKSVKMEEPLSERELDVLKLIAQGLSNKEIGTRLHIETRTVKWHTSNIFGKLGVKNRTQAVAKAREFAIVDASAISLPKTE